MKRKEVLKKNLKKPLNNQSLLNLIQYHLRGLIDEDILFVCVVWEEVGFALMAPYATYH